MGLTKLMGFGPEASSFFVH